MKDSVNEQRTEIPKVIIPETQKQSHDTELTIVLKTELFEKYKSHRTYHTE